MRRDDVSYEPTLTPSQAPGESSRDPSRDDTAVAATETPPPSRPGGAPANAPRSGYQLRETLGRGGMGEVVLATDLRFERDVAVKRMRSATPTDDAIARFWREAKIQARLDHPAIVPVHDCGFDAEGRPYFTMKRLAGTTLHDVLAQGTSTQQKLLRAFVDICFAIQFAHERGVIHRDLKPANAMLGDYGEVYVLDWGVARIAGDRDGAAADGDGASDDGASTQAGAVLGTPGYMSPEQLRGDEVTPATDVYALGAMLFEILAGEPLHPRGSRPAPLTGDEASPARRKPALQLPPELDTICVAALAKDPAQRPTARELADRIQQYLDGDRDLELRRTRATRYLAEAREVLATNDPDRRPEAMRAAGYALSLDPDSQAAAALVSQIMLQPIPRKQTPDSLRRRFEQLDGELARRQGRLAQRAIGSFMLFLPVFAWVGVLDWWVVGGMFAILAVTAATTPWVARWPTRLVWHSVASTFAMLLLLSRMASPLIVVPMIALSATVSLVSFPKLQDRTWIVIGAMTAAFLVPVGLELAGVWEPTWWIADGVLQIRPTAIVLEESRATVLVVSANLAVLFVMALYGRSLARTHREAQRKLEIQAWHLGQLLPVTPPRPSVEPAPDICAITGR